MDPNNHELLHKNKFQQKLSSIYRKGTSPRQAAGN